MKRKNCRKVCSLIGVAGCLVSSYVLMSCVHSVADPNVDSIFFDPDRAQKERIEPRKQKLKNVNEQTAAEKIKTTMLQGQLREMNAQIKGLERQVASLDSQIAVAQSRKKKAASQGASTKVRSISSEEQKLIARRNEMSKQVSQDKAKLAKMLKTR